MEGSKMILLACLSILMLQQSASFVQPALSQATALGLPQQRHGASPQIAKQRAAVSALRMAKKGGGSAGSKRKKKKAAAAQGGGAATIRDKTPASSDDGFEDAGAPMMAGGGVGFVDVKTAKRGEVLEEGVIGTDAAREAKIEETLRKMGVQSIGEVRAEKAAEEEEKSVADQITSIFDLIPAETQLVMERVFIAGFAVCLVFLVGCGCAIGVEAYYLSTAGKLPPDLDNFIVKTLEPLFTPSLGATFLFSSCLGILKLGQMGQESVVYREEE